MKHFLALFLLIPGLAWADGHLSIDLPILSDVTGVASNDSLNIRIDPHHGTDIVGTLAHNARDIEVVETSQDGRWSRVNSGEASGWVRNKFLSQASDALWHDFETSLACVGTEPFWVFAINEGATSANFEAIDGPATTYDIDWVSGLIARPIYEIGLGAGTSEDGFSAVIDREHCSDGMSDRSFALKIRLFVHKDGDTSGYGGCCSLDP
jgi:uncharacterized membrane protein